MMNRNGLKPESLKGEPELTAPDFISAVGDDSITRFDRPKGKGRRGRSRGGKQRGKGNGGGSGNGGSGSGSGGGSSSGANGGSKA